MGSLLMVRDLKLSVRSGVDFVFVELFFDISLFGVILTYSGSSMSRLVLRHFLFLLDDCDIIAKRMNSVNSTNIANDTPTTGFAGEGEV